MKTKTKKRLKNSYRLWASLACLVLVVGVWAIWYRHSHKSPVIPDTSSNGIRSAGSIDFSPAKPGENVANNQRKSSSTPSSTLPQSTPSSNSSSTFPSIAIAGASADGSAIKVSATVQNVISGTCTFNFSRLPGGMILQTSSEQVDYSGTYYTCPIKSVTMPSPASGDWYVSAIVTSGSQTATATWPQAVTL